MAIGDRGLEARDARVEIAFLSHLGDCGIQFVGFAIRDHFAAIFGAAFGKFGKKVSGRRALDQMVSHYSMHYVFGAALGHVAGDAVRAGGMGADLDDAVTLAAHGVVMTGRGGAVRNVVRIVAGGAGQRAFALEEALRFAKAIGRADDLEFIVLSDLIEEKDEGGERLAGTVGIGSAVESADGVGEGRTGGFEMTLLAHFDAES